MVAVAWSLWHGRCGMVAVAWSLWHAGSKHKISAFSSFLHQCTVDRKQLLLAFNEVAQELNVTGVDGSICSLPVVECHHHDNDDDDEEDHHDNDDDVEDHHDNRKREHIDDYHGECEY